MVIEIGYIGKTAGQDSTYEKRAATSILVEQARERLGMEEMTSEQIFEQAVSKNTDYLLILDEWFEEVAKGIATIICIVDPGLLIIGGGVSAQKDYLTAGILKKIPLFLPEGFFENTSIKAAECGNDAGMVGAVYEFIHFKDC